MPVSTSIEKFLTPIPGGNGAGEEVDYDESYLLLERVLQGKPEQQYGETIIAAEEPDWRDVLRLSSELLEKSKDFRVAIAYLRALSNIYGWDGCVNGFELLIFLVEKFWESGYPALEYEGEIDFFPRANALAALYATDGFLKDFKKLSVNLPNYGSISIADIEKIRVNKQDGDGKEYHIIQQAMMAAARERHESFEKFLALRNKLQEFSALLKGKVSVEYFSDIDLLLKILESSFKAMGSLELQHVVQLNELEANAHEDKADELLVNGYNRNAIIARLNSICEEIERYEPSNPAPLLIRRGIKMIELDFISILKQLAPDALSQVYNVIGQEEE